jgi:hypothetical protein
MQPRRAVKGIVLSPEAPSEARGWVNDFLESVSSDAADVGDEIVLEIATLASELIADATDHGSDEATIRLILDETMVRVEVFDAPRRSMVALSGWEEGVPALRRLVLRQMADGWTSEELGDGHLSSCEIILRHDEPGRP